jgi:hypothetical protein
MDARMILMYFIEIGDCEVDWTEFICDIGQYFV